MKNFIIIYFGSILFYPDPIGNWVDRHAGFRISLSALTVDNIMMPVYETVKMLKLRLSIPIKSLFKTGSVNSLTVGLSKGILYCKSVFFSCKFKFVNKIYLRYLYVN